jgi:hypothetical protein
MMAFSRTKFTPSEQPEKTPFITLDTNGTTRLSREDAFHEVHFDFLLNLALTSSNLELLSALTHFPRIAVAQWASYNLALLKNKVLENEVLENEVLGNSNSSPMALPTCPPDPRIISLERITPLIRLLDIPSSELLAYRQWGVLEAVLLAHYPFDARAQEPTETWDWLEQYLCICLSSLVRVVDQLNLAALLHLGSVHDLALLLAVHPHISTSQLERLWQESLDYTVCRLISLHPRATDAMRNHMALESQYSW